MPQKTRPDPSNGTIVNADEYEGLSLGSFTDGVIGDAYMAPVVFADSTGRQVKIRAGQQATVRGYSWWSDPAIAEIVNGDGAGLPANTSGLPRIDRLVLRLDRSARTLKPVYLQGAPAINGPATPPALTQDTSQSFGLWDFPLARWLVPNGYTTITAESVINEAWYRPPGSHGILCTSTSRPLGNYLHYGMEIYEYDTTIYRRWDGTSWVQARAWEKRIFCSTDQGVVTIPNIPHNLRNLRIQYTARSNGGPPGNVTDIFARINGVSSNSYYSNYNHNRNGVLSGHVDRNAPWCLVGAVPMNGAHYGTGVVEISGWDAVGVDRVHILGRAVTYTSDLDSILVDAGGTAITPPPYTSISFQLFFGAIGSGSNFLVQGWE